MKKLIGLACCFPAGIAGGIYYVRNRDQVDSYLDRKLAAARTFFRLQYDQARAWLASVEAPALPSEKAS